jgi:hypothetical protein
MLVLQFFQLAAAASSPFGAALAGRYGKNRPPRSYHIPSDSFTSNGKFDRCISIGFCGSVVSPSASR